MSLRAIFSRSWGRTKEAPPLLEAPAVQAVDALIAGDEEAALRHLGAAVRQDRRDLRSAIRLAEILRRRGDVERAFQIHRTQLTRADLSRADHLRIRLEMAKDLIAAERFVEARDITDKILDDDRRHQEARGLRIEILERLDRWDEAFEELKTLQKFRGSRDRKELARYQAYLAGRLLGHARRVAEEAPERPWRSTDLAVKEEARAVAVDVRQHWGEARTYLKRALKLDPCCVPALLYQGEIEAASGDLSRADRSWRKALSDGDRDEIFAVFEPLERLHYEQDRYDEIERFYREHLARHPGDARARLRLSEYHRRRGDATLALAAIGDPLDHEGAIRKALARERVQALAAAGQTDTAVTEALALSGPGGNNELTCGHCGTAVREALWRCPECGKWRTFF